MKKYLFLFAATLLVLLPARAQLGPTGGGSSMDEAMTKVFGTNLNFSADMEVHVNMMPKQNNVTMTGKMYFAGGNSRSEMDMTTMKSRQMPPQAIAQMKKMGMDKVVSISRADQKLVYMIYPGLQAYAKMAISDATQAKTNDFKVETKDLGRAAFDGHPCLKKQYTLNNPRTGERMIMTTWNATDLKDCPIKVEQSFWTSADTYNGTTTTMLFKNVNLTRPDASLFEPPAGYKVYDDIRTMMQTEMMKKMSAAGMATPPGQ